MLARDRPKWEKWEYIFDNYKMTLDQKDKFISFLSDSEKCSSLKYGHEVNVLKTDADHLISNIVHSLGDNEYILFLDVLASGVEIGVREYSWIYPQVAPPKTIKRNTPAFNASGNQSVIYFEAIEDHLNNADNLEVNNLSDSAHRGLLFCSLLIHSGVLSGPMFLCVIKNIKQKKKLIRARSLTFVQLEKNKFNQTRMLLHVITELVFLGMRNKAIDGINATKSSIFSDIEQYGNETGLPVSVRPDNYNRLLKWAVAASVRRYPRDLTDYAVGHVKTTQLFDKAFSRLMRVEWDVGKEGYYSERSNLNGDEFDNVRCGSALFELIEAVNVNVLSKCISNINFILEKYRNKSGSSKNVFILTSWVYQYIGDQDFSWAVVKRNALYLVNGVAQIIYGSLGEKDLSLLSADEYISLYESSINLVSPKLRRTVATQCWQLHVYLVGNYNSIKVEKSNAIFDDYLRCSVHAQMITFSEFKYFLKLLEKEADADHAFNIALIASLGFLAGIRTTEAHKILRNDISYDGCALFVHEHVGYRLKTFNAKRKIPLNATLDAPTRKMLDQKIDGEDFDSSDLLGQYLFGGFDESYKKSPDRKRIAKVLHGALREATNDSDVRYYSLRHSSFSWLMLSLLWPPGLSNKWLGLDSESQRYMDNAESVSRSFQGLEDLPDVSPQVRQSIYYLFRNHGHGSATTSFEHYMHLFDLLWYAYLKDYYGEPSIKSLSNLTGYTVRTVREANNANSLNKLLENIRKQNINRIDILPLMDEKKHQDINSDKASNDFVVWCETCLRIIEQHTIYGITVDELSERFDLIEAVINKILECSNVFYDVPFLKTNELCVQTKSKSKKSVLLLKSAREQVDKTLVSECLKKLFCNINEDPSVGFSEVEYLVKETKWRKYGASFDDGAKAMKYISWLNAIGIKHNHLKIIHTHGIGSTTNINEQAKIWRKDIGLPKKCRIQSVRLSNKRPMKPKGRLTVAVVVNTKSSPTVEVASTSYAFPLAVAMTYLFWPIYCYRI